MTQQSIPNIRRVVAQEVARFKKCDPCILELDMTFAEQLHLDWLDMTRLVTNLEKELNMEIGLHLGDFPTDFPATPELLIKEIVCIAKTSHAEA